MMGAMMMRELARAFLSCFTRVTQIRPPGQRGQAVIQTVGLLFVTLFVGALAIDTGFYFARHQGMRNASEAAALAATSELFRTQASSISLRQSAARNAARTLSQQNMNNQLNDADIEFGYVNPQGSYNASTFLTPTSNKAFAATGGYNAVRVTVRAAQGQANSAVPTLFAKLFGINSVNAAARTVAIYGGAASSVGGLRPVYMCQAAWDYAQNNFGDATIPVVRFYGETLMVNGNTVNAANSCGNLGPGNWGLADLDNGNGAVGASTVRNWFANGYDGQVIVGQWYDAQPGNSINAYSSELSALQNAGTVITIPLYSQTRGNGSNAEYRVSSIAGFVITNFQSTGSNRFIEGYFRRALCHNCTLGNPPISGALTRIRMVN